MVIVWDEPKRVANLDKHEMDFGALTAEFFIQATIYPAKRGRLIAVGYFEGMIAVVFVLLGTEAVSVISMRPASKSERKRL